MKVCTYLRQTPLGQFKRLGIFFNETTIVDVNLIWQKQFEIDGVYDAKEKASGRESPCARKATLIGEQRARKATLHGAAHAT